MDVGSTKRQCEGKRKRGDRVREINAQAADDPPAPVVFGCRWVRRIGCCVEDSVVRFVLYSLQQLQFCFCFFFIEDPAMVCGVCRLDW